MVTMNFNREKEFSLSRANVEEKKPHLKNHKRACVNRGYSSIYMDIIAIRDFFFIPFPGSYALVVWFVRKWYGFPSNRSKRTFS
jgi:hypothetical protein